MKLEEIPKKNIFETPEGYFEKLPMEIQSRIQEKKVVWQRPVVRYSLRYAIPAILLLMVVYLGVRPDRIQDPEEIIAQVSSEDLLAYIENADYLTFDALDPLLDADLDLLEIEIEIPDLADEDDLEDYIDELEFLEGI